MSDDNCAVLVAKTKTRPVVIVEPMSVDGVNGEEGDIGAEYQQMQTNTQMTHDNGSYIVGSYRLCYAIQKQFVEREGWFLDKQHNLDTRI